MVDPRFELVCEDMMALGPMFLFGIIVLVTIVDVTLF